MKDLTDLIVQAIGDPGSIVGPRRGPGYLKDSSNHAEEYEDTTRWSARAVLAVLIQEGRLVLPTIRVVERGDYADQMVLRVIGPYPTQAERDVALDRLKGLPLMSELAWLSAGTIPPGAAEQAITPEAADWCRTRTGCSNSSGPNRD